MSKARLDHHRRRCRGTLQEPGRPRLRGLPLLGPAAGPAVRTPRARPRSATLETSALQPARGRAAVGGRDRPAPQGADPGRTGRRRGHDPHPSGPSHPEVRAGPAAPARRLDDLAGAGPPWIRHPAASEATPLVLAPVRGRAAQRALAGRHHPLAAGRRHRAWRSSTSSTTTPGSPWPASPAAPSPAPTSCTRSKTPSCAGESPPACSPTTVPSSPAAPPRRPGRPRDRARPPRRPVRPLPPQPPPDPGQGRTIPADREEVARRAAPAKTIAGLQRQLTRFRTYYNEVRPAPSPRPQDTLGGLHRPPQGHRDRPLHRSRTAASATTASTRRHRDAALQQPTAPHRTVVPPESWRASLCGFPVGGRGVLVVDRAHHARRAVPALVVVEAVAPVEHDGLGLAGVREVVA